MPSPPISIKDRAMLMVLVIDIFQNDWGVAGGISVLMLWAAWAMFQAHLRYLASNAKGE